MHRKQLQSVEWPTETRPAWRTRSEKPSTALSSQLGDDPPTLSGRITVAFLEEQAAAAEETCEMCEQTELCLLHG